jgi:ABC-2 type transport system permease protein
MTLTLIAIPVIFQLLFVYVFSGALGAGLGGTSGDRAEYANYVTPGILLLSIAAGAISTATSVATDMTEGIIARLGVALAVGFRPNANPLEWLAAAGILVATAIAITWLSRSAWCPRPSKAPATCPCR